MGPQCLFFSVLSVRNAFPSSPVRSQLRSTLGLLCVVVDLNRQEMCQQLIMQTRHGTSWIVKELTVPSTLAEPRLAPTPEVGSYPAAKAHRIQIYPGRSDRREGHVVLPE